MVVYSYSHFEKKLSIKNGIIAALAIVCFLLLLVIGNLSEQNSRLESQLITKVPENIEYRF